jgi:hypothetical protein
MKTKFAFIIYFTFILFTVIGTLTHEFGHFIIGRYLGYKSSIHYGYTSHGRNDLQDEIMKIYTQNEELIDKKKEFPQKREFEILTKKSDNNKFWVILGGPISNILIGSIGFILVLWFRKKYGYAQTTFHWFCLFLTFFWMRQPNNLFSWLMKTPVNGRSVLNGDEIKLAKYLNLPLGSIIWTTGILGSFICGYAILKFVPKDKLRLFLMSGFIGGFSGFILWLKILGPVILP